MTGDLMAQVDALMGELAAMGVEVADGMPVPGDDDHARMAVHMLSAMVHAHRNGRHTAYCRCALSGDAATGPAPRAGS